tara:strand:- start:2165 stop:2311 length:147 start_codon:yes stop_codon:yes gene_type:complete
MDLRKTKDYIGDRRKKLNTMRLLLQGVRPAMMPDKKSAAQRFKDKYTK